MRSYIIGFCMIICCSLAGKAGRTEQAGSSSGIRELQHEVELHYNQPDIGTYLEALLERSVRLDSQRIMNEALSELMNYCFSNGEMERFDYWVAYLDQLTEQQRINPDIYFDVHRNKARVLLSGGCYQEAVGEAVLLYERAQSIDRPYGKICSSEVLGLIYKTGKQDSAAVVSFREALQGLQQLGGYPDRELRVVSYLIDSYLRQGDLPQVEVMLGQLDRLLGAPDGGPEGANPDRETKKYRWLQQVFYAAFHLKTNRIEQAKEALDKADSYYQEKPFTRDKYISFYYLYTKACYYRAIKSYDEALAVLDSELKDTKEVDAIDLKAEILSETGRFEAALPVYDILFSIMKSYNNESLVRQINSLRVLYDKNEQKQREAELKINNLQIAEKQRVALFVSLASLVLLVFLGVLTRYLLRLRRYKKELTEERNSLIVSRESLDQEKIKAEKANYMKDAFIANISHGIRTPLNAIVGFSNLLSESDMEEDEKKEFVDLINKNTGVLLSLVNDVLDLSRIESGSYRAQVEPFDLIGCCREALSNARQKLVRGVDLKFTSDVSTFTISAASVYLCLLLSKLLDNAAQFTHEGEIELRLELIESEHRMQFTVTDTGAGIPLDRQEQVFERFEKLDALSPGTGLGLTICKTVSEQLGGTLSIDPAYTTGTRFVFSCPYTEADPHVVV